MKISLDLDGVLTSTFHIAVHTDYTAIGKTGKSLEEFWLDADGTYNAREVRNWIETDIYYSHMNVTLADLEIVKELKRLGHTLFYITSRPMCVMLTTENWIRRNNLPDRQNLIFSTQKEEVIKELSIQLHVEDMIHHANKTKEVCKTLLMDRVWNWGYEEKNIFRIYSLKEILNNL